MQDFEHTKLWKSTLAYHVDDEQAESRELLRSTYSTLRNRAQDVLSHISSVLPELTKHDMVHPDALWEMADLVAGSDSHFSPAEAFLLGSAFIFHDAALSAISFENGRDDIMAKPYWRDAIVAGLISRGLEVCEEMIEKPPDDLVKSALFTTLRAIHAKEAERLPLRPFIRPDNGEKIWLIPDDEIREYYGQWIGKIAASHGWDIETIGRRFPRTINAGPGVPSEWTADPIRLACLLRAADAIQIDHRRAPIISMVISNPSEISREHWIFQNKLGKPTVNDDAIVFTGGEFDSESADIWWRCYDTLTYIDKELRLVDGFLDEKKVDRFRARRVLGIESPEALNRLITTIDWQPVDTTLKIKDVPRIVEMFGGKKLYGDDPAVPLRELIQNSADAIRAKRILTGSNNNSGRIIVRLRENDSKWWLDVIDDGIGMSVRVLTQTLLDFGGRFWTGSIVREELPGLIGSGMKPSGQFGIGFFSVFMLGSHVIVTSRRFDSSASESKSLEFRGGLGSRAILRQPDSSELLFQAGTRISIELEITPLEKGGLLNREFGWYGKPLVWSLADLVAWLAPALDVTIEVEETSSKSVPVEANDWLKLSPDKLIRRILPGTDPPKICTHMTQIENEDGEVLARLFVSPGSILSQGGVLVSDGLRVKGLSNVAGIVLTKGTDTLARNSAIPSIQIERLSDWASDQAVRLVEHVEKKMPFSRQPPFLFDCAKIIVDCGGDISDLPIATIDNISRNKREIIEFLSQRDEIRIIIGDIYWDQELDEDILPKDFDNNFEIDSELVLLQEGQLSIARMLVIDSESAVKNKPRTLQELFWHLVADVWKDFEKEEEEEKIGNVNGKEVIRRVIKVYRPEDEE